MAMRLTVPAYVLARVVCLCTCVPVCLWLWTRASQFHADQWIECDDDSVSAVSARKVQGPASYILFYRRRQRATAPPAADPAVPAATGTPPGAGTGAGTGAGAGAEP